VGLFLTSLSLFVNLNILFVQCNKSRSKMSNATPPNDALTVRRVRNREASPPQTVQVWLIIGANGKIHALPAQPHRYADRGDGDAYPTEEIQRQQTQVSVISHQGADRRGGVIACKFPSLCFWGGGLKGGNSFVSATSKPRITHVQY
jgi:hypothetical protein